MGWGDSSPLVVFLEGLLILNVLALPVAERFPLFNADISYSSAPNTLEHASTCSTFYSQ